MQHSEGFKRSPPGREQHNIARTSQNNNNGPDAISAILGIAMEDPAGTFRVGRPWHVANRFIEDLYNDIRCRTSIACH